VDSYEFGVRAEARLLALREAVFFAERLLLFFVAMASPFRLRAMDHRDHSATNLRRR
jgi:hypothetical protein